MLSIYNKLINYYFYRYKKFLSIDDEGLVCFYL